MTFDDEINEAREYVKNKLRPACDFEEVWDLYTRSTLGVSFAAFAQAIGNSRRVKLTDGRSRAYAKRR
jgi:hypothetical protein